MVRQREMRDYEREDREVGEKITRRLQFVQNIQADLDTRGLAEVLADILLDPDSYLTQHSPA